MSHHNTEHTHSNWRFHVSLHKWRTVTSRNPDLLLFLPCPVTTQDTCTTSWRFYVSLPKWRSVMFGSICLLTRNSCPVTKQNTHITISRFYVSLHKDRTEILEAHISGSVTHVLSQHTAPTQQHENFMSLHKWRRALIRSSCLLLCNPHAVTAWNACSTIWRYKYLSVTERQKCLEAEVSFSLQHQKSTHMTTSRFYASA